jgi:hypothetical protein
VVEQRFTLIEPSRGTVRSPRQWNGIDVVPLVFGTKPPEPASVGGLFRASGSVVPSNLVHADPLDAARRRT